MKNDKKKVDVVDWQDIPPLIVARACSPSRYFSPVPIGIIGTLLIHALILPSAYFGSYGTKVHRPEIQEPSAFSKLGVQLGRESCAHRVAYKIEFQPRCGSIHLFGA